MKRILAKIFPTAVALAGAVGVALITILEGGDWGPRLFAVFVYGITYLLAYSLSGRIRFAAVAAATLPIFIYLVSRIKFHFLGMPFLFFDLIYLVRSNFLELVQNDPRFAVATLGIACPIPVLLVLIWRLEARKSIRPVFLKFSIGATIALFFVSYPSLARFDSMDLIAWEHKIATFFVSAARTEIRLEPRPVSLALPHDNEVVFPLKRLPKVLPDILIVLEESTVDVREFINVDTRNASGLRRFFSPEGGKHGRLFVHTFGGQTWLSEFAFLVGIPHSSFGTNGLYGTFLLQGRVKHSLPKYLHDLGYQTIAVYPNSGNFVNTKRFYKSIGFDHFLDPSELSPKREWTWRTPDDEILGTALEVLRQQREHDKRPAFLMTLTINQHGPHSMESTDPESNTDFRRTRVPASHVGEFREYMHRFNESTSAVDKLAARYSALFPGRSAVILHFGDHHPAISKHLDFGNTGHSPARDPLLRTYFSIMPIHYALKASSLDKMPEIDIAFLPLELLESVGLPLDEVWTLRRNLALDCAGDYTDCASPLKTQLHGFLLEQKLILD